MENELMTYWKRVDSFPEDLREIFVRYWDDTGRPKVMYPKNDMIMALLEKNSVEGGKSFLKDMKLIFPDISQEESSIYYNVYIAGANYIANRLKSG